MRNLRREARKGRREARKGRSKLPNKTEILSNVYKIWIRPVAVRTKAEDKSILAKFDGEEEEYKEEQIEEPISK